MGSMLAQYDEDRRKERAIYYLSKKRTDYDLVYQFGENLLGFGLGNAEIEALHAVLLGTFNSSHGPPKKSICSRNPP